MKHNKYRIVKHEKKNGFNEIIKIEYFIEKRFLFWWIKAKITSGYTLPKYNGGSSDMIIGKHIYTFSSIEQANIFLDHYLLNPYKEIYKGNKIIRIVNAYNWDEVFVNKSHITEVYGLKSCYEFSKRLESLKKRIDERIIKTEKSIV